MNVKDEKFRYFDVNLDQKKVPAKIPWSNRLPPKNFIKHAGGKKDGKSEEEKKMKSVMRKEKMKQKQEKKKRIIIRNLSFKVDEAELKNILSKFGTVVDVIIPKKKDGKLRGFAFAQFEKFKSCVQAIRDLNFKELHGRRVAIDYAVAKDKYEHTMSSRKVSEPSQNANDGNDESGSDLDAADIKQEPDDDSGVEEESESGSPIADSKDRKVSHFMEELEFDQESDEEEASKLDDSESESSSDDEFGSDEEEADKLSKNEEQKSKPVPQRSENMVNDEGQKKKSSSSDVAAGKTVFVRNICFETTEENLKEAMSEFGSIVYCLLCIDPVTEMPRGSAFIKFEEKEQADALISKSESENGIYLDGRKLFCSPALSREDVQNKPKGKEKRDKRNLYLLKEGFIMSNSEEAKNVPPADLAKREKLEIMKKKKLRNVNFFVSLTRLCVYNIPERFTNENLRKLFLSVAGRYAVVTEARIMKDMKKLNAKGEPKSRKFGFVAFTRHENALQALRKLNNHPTAFHPQSRPIVEFAIENHRALLVKRQRQERNRLRSMTKPSESKDSTTNVSRRQRFKRKRNKKNKPSDANSTELPHVESEKKNKKPRTEQQNSLPSHLPKSKRRKTKKSKVPRFGQPLQHSEGAKSMNQRA